MLSSRVENNGKSKSIVIKMRLFCPSGWVYCNQQSTGYAVAGSVTGGKVSDGTVMLWVAPHSSTSLIVIVYLVN